MIDDWGSALKKNNCSKRTTIAAAIKNVKLTGDGGNRREALACMILKSLRIMLGDLQPKSILEHVDLENFQAWRGLMHSQCTLTKQRPLAGVEVITY